MLRVLRKNPPKGGDDALLYALALHDGREESDLESETIGIISQLVAEVAIACGCLGGDDGNVLTEEGQTEFALKVEDPFGLELTDNLLTFAGHITEGVGGIDVGNNPGETIGLMELGIDFQQHLHAGMESLACGALEPWTDEHPFRGPAAG